MKSSLIWFAALAFGALPAAAQVRPVPGSSDAHIQVIDYSPDQVVVIEGAPGYQVTLELAPDEQIRNVAVGDSRAWQATANHSGDHLFVKAVVAGVSTNMAVVTNQRLYSFELIPLRSPGAIAHVIRFRYPGAVVQKGDDQALGMETEGLYRLRGRKALWPSEISDDGTHTYIRWPRGRSLPAVYAVNDGGQEMLVNGMMREDDVFTIDDISRKLVFRVDDQVATAERVDKRK